MSVIFTMSCCGMGRYRWSCCRIGWKSIWRRRDRDLCCECNRPLHDGPSSVARLQRMQGPMALGGWWRNIALQHQPKNAVVELIIYAIRFAKVQPFRHTCGCGLLRILFVQILCGDDWVIRRQIDCRCEDVCEGAAEVIKLREPAHAEDVLDRRNNVCRVDEAMYSAWPVVR